MTAEEILRQQEAAFVGTEKGNDAFAREERKFIGRIKILETAFMPEEILERRQIDYASDDFKQAYPHGLMALHIAVEGISVQFTGVPDSLLHLWVPMMDDRPAKYGQPKRRRSNLHIVSEAFESVWKMRPFGAENQGKLVGQVAEWGQHLGDGEIEGDKREWAWDIPRKVLPVSFKYEGPVREINVAPRAAGGGAVANTSSVVELSDDEAIAAMIAAVNGLPVEDLAECASRILSIPGLPGKWNQHALEGTVMRELGMAQFITAVEENGVQIVRPGTAAA